MECLHNKFLYLQLFYLHLKISFFHLVHCLLVSVSKILVITDNTDLFLQFSVNYSVFAQQWAEITDWIDGGIHKYFRFVYLKWHFMFSYPLMRILV